MIIIGFEPGSLVSEPWFRARIRDSDIHVHIGIDAQRGLNGNLCRYSEGNTQSGVVPHCIYGQDGH